MLWDRAGIRDCTPEPLVNDEMESVDKADSRRFDACFLGDSLHLQTDQVVGQKDAPKFLCDGFWTFAPDRLFPLQHLGLDFIVPKLKFPAFMIETDDLVRGKSFWIRERCEQKLWPKSLALVANGACDPCLG